MDHAASPDGNITAKLVVPNATAGLIIGKAGATIKQIMETSGCHIQISQKDDQNPGINERIVTVVGGLEAIAKAVAEVVSKMTDDPSSGTYSNLSTNYGAR